jgi:hypothetical protein
LGNTPCRRRLRFGGSALVWPQPQLPRRHFRRRTLY